MFKVDKLGKHSYFYEVDTAVNFALITNGKCSIQYWSINITFATDVDVKDVSIDGFTIDEWLKTLLNHTIITNDPKFNALDETPYIRNVEYTTPTYITSLISEILTARLENKITENSLKITINVE